MIEVNLLPWRHLLRQKKKKRAIVMWSSGVVIILGVWLWVHLWLGQAINQIEKENHFLKGQMLDFDKSIAQIQTDQQQKQKILADIQHLELLKKKQGQVMLWLKGLENIIASGTYVNSFEKKSNTFLIQGGFLSSEYIIKGLKNISKSTIYKSNFVRNVKIDSENAQFMLEIESQTDLHQESSK